MRSGTMINLCRMFLVLSVFELFDEVITEGNSSNNYDLVVIGGGSGGLACAKEAASYGKKVAVLDFVTPSSQGTTWGLGGACLNVGCIPKKLMHHAALLGEAIHDAVKFGWEIPVPSRIKLNWFRLVESVQNHIINENWATSVELRDKTVEYINGHGHFKDPNTVIAVLKDGSEQVLKADHVVIACGGRPFIPEIPGAKDFCITSDDLFSLKKPPGKTLIIGGGYIGLESAGLLQGLGFDTTVMERSAVLKGFDLQMKDLIVEEMVQRGVRFLHKYIPVSFQRTRSGKILAKWKNSVDNTEGSEDFDTCLIATGRRARTKELKADSVGIDLDPYSFEIDAKQEQTNVPNIFAVGDVLKGRPVLSPVAVQAGKLLAARLYGESQTQMDYTNIPTTVFTPLEYGCVGYPEEVAIEQYGEDKLEIYHAFCKPLEFSIPRRNAARCYLKVICLRNKPRTVVGMHFLGPQAGEVIQGYAAAMKSGLTFDELESTIGIHPTVSESFTQLVTTKRSGLALTPQSYFQHQAEKHQAEKHQGKDQFVTYIKSWYHDILNVIF